MRIFVKVAGLHTWWSFAALGVALALAGCGTSNTPVTATATPSFSPAGGTFNASQIVTIADTTKGAVLYCTVDGTTPTAASPQCSQPTTVFKSEYLQAIAIAPGMPASTVTSAGYTIDLTAAATPTFSPAGGTFTSAQVVTIADATVGANLFYTLDGTVPSASSTLYTGPVTLSSTQTIIAVAIASGYNDSGVASATYTINPFAATPVFTPAGGTFSTAQMITIIDATAGAAVYYTLDGTVPSASSALYGGPIAVSASGTLNAIATAPNFTNSAIGSAAYIISPPAAVPVFSPVAGSYNSVQTVTLGDATPGTAIYYTTDGSTPTSESNLYTGPVTVAKSETLSAIAIAPGYTSSAVATSAYTITLPTATPVFSVVAGTYSSIQTVTLSDATAGASIYYTLNGGAPTAASTLYVGAITVSTSETIDAIAIAPGYNSSAVATSAYTIMLPTATPVFSVATGSYSSIQTVTLSDATAGASIYYTLNGSNPTSASTLYIGPITVSASETINAIAIAPGYNSSAVATAAYAITLPAATPAFSVAAGSYTAIQTVALSDATSGAAIFYTLNGDPPTSASIPYSGPIRVSASETINAIAVAPGFSSSTIATASYTISLTTATPVFSVAAGSYNTVQTVTITDATPGAAIYYTTNGSAPTSGSTPYSAPVTISATATLNALAIASGYANSPISTAAYIINLSAAATPTFSPAAGAYTSVQTVTIGDATGAAELYYTIDGSTPTSASTRYIAPVLVGSTETIKAIAIATGFTNSGVGTAAYTIELPAATPTFSPAAGTYTSAQTVTISDATVGAALYYTIDGSAPTSASSRYTAPVVVGGTETIKAIAVATGFTDSNVGTVAYTINLPATATPTFSLAAGTYLGTQTNTISDATANAVIYYTTDGRAPTSSSTQYTGPISVSATETVKALAVAPGHSVSGVATAVYTISQGNASLQGTVLSGTLPIQGAQVQLYAAGLTGYGSPATALLSASVATDNTGAFSFSYNCAASPGDLVYLIASGGDAGAGANANLKLMAALGPCGRLTSATRVVVNEVTTVASAYALSAFITTAPNVGSSSTNYAGLTNAFAAVNNLVDRTTGVALTITPAYAANPVAYLNSSTVPQTRIDTLANLLNGCVNSNGATCANLFSAATPTAGTAPTNTLQAMIDIAQNPGRGVTALFSLASPTGPFQPVLTAAPGDLTLALTFTGAGLGIPPGTTTNTGEGPINNVSLAIDAAGDIWVAASRYNATLSPAGPLVAKFTNLGAPVTPATLLSAASPPVITIGGYNPDSSTGQILSSVNVETVAIDETGFLWLSVSNPVVKIDPALSATPVTYTLGGNGADPIQSLAIDNSGNVWAGGLYINEVSGSASPLLTDVNGQSTAGTGPSYQSLFALTFDSNLNLWAVDKLSNGGADLYQISSSTGNIQFDAFPGGVTTPGATYPSLVADGGGNIYGCADATGTSLNVFNNGAATQTYPLTSLRGCGNQLVLDGQNHIFVVTNNYIFNQTAAIDEYTTGGVQLSPAIGYTGSSMGEPATISFSTLNGVGASSAAIDGSGNLWVLNNGTNGVSGYDQYFNPIPDYGNVLVEYIGLAAPVVTPNSVAVQNSTLGVRP